MKFTKDEARKELSAQMTARGEKLNLSERSINEQLETLMPLLQNEETELQDFIAKVLPIFKTTDANVRNDVSAGINEFKTKHSSTQKQDPTKTQVSPDSDVAALVERLEKMEKELADAKRENRVADVKKQLLTKMKELGVKNTEWVKDFISEIAITEDFDVDSKAKTYLSIYNKAMANTPPNITTAGASGGSSSSASKAMEETIKQASEFASTQRLDANN